MGDRYLHPIYSTIDIYGFFDKLVEYMDKEGLRYETYARDRLKKTDENECAAFGRQMRRWASGAKHGFGEYKEQKKCLEILGFSKEAIVREYGLCLTADFSTLLKRWPAAMDELTRGVSRKEFERKYPKMAKKIILVCEGLEILKKDQDSIYIEYTNLEAPEGTIAMEQMFAAMVDRNFGGEESRVKMGAVNFRCSESDVRRAFEKFLEFRTFLVDLYEQVRYKPLSERPSWFSASMWMDIDIGVADGMITKSKSE